MRTQTKNHRQRPNNFNHEEKRNLYLQWERSGKSKAAFCQSLGITKSAFYSWCHRFKLRTPSDTVFSPVTLKNSPTTASENVMQLEICLPNQTKVLIQMQQPNAISFIQELCHAATAIR